MFEKYSEITSGVLLSAISDHMPIFVFLKTKISSECPSKLIKVKPSAASVDLFRNEIINSEMYASLDKDINSNPNSNYNTIHNIIDKAKKLHFHSKTVTFNKHKHNKSEWITSGIIISIQFCDNMYRKLKETPSDTAEHSRIKTNLHTYNNILKGNIRLAKKMYYHACFPKTKLD